MKAIALFMAGSVVLIAVAGLLLALVFRGDAARNALMVSAGIALVVQLATFSIVRLAARENVIAGWALGALLRMLVLAVYGLVVVKAAGLDPVPALVSMALFLFVTTLLEPVLLRS